MYLDFWPAIAINHFITKHSKKKSQLVKKKKNNNNNNIQTASSGRVLVVAENFKAFIWLVDLPRLWSRNGSYFRRNNGKDELIIQIEGRIWLNCFPKQFRYVSVYRIVIVTG